MYSRLSFFAASSVLFRIGYEALLNGESDLFIAEQFSKAHFPVDPTVLGSDVQFLNT